MKTARRNLQSAILHSCLFRVASLALLLSFLISLPVRAEDLHINLDKREDGHVKPRIDTAGFSIHVDVEGNLQKLDPTTVHCETQQKGRWVDAKLDAGRYLKPKFDPENPGEFRIESSLKFDFASGERRYAQERDTILREAAQKTAGAKDAAVAIKVRTQLFMEHLAAIREENVKAGADRRGKGTPHAPPLPRQALSFEKQDALERLLKEQCCWQSVAEVFKMTHFPPPDEKEYPEFAASQVMASEIQQALMGNKIVPRHLSEAQYNALAQGNRYQFSARFIPELPAATTDIFWRNAPAVRLADGLVKRVQLEGSLDRQRDQTVGWWRVECDTPNRLDPKMAKGDGDCFWTWVETPDSHVRYLRLLLHSPGTRYRMTLSLAGAAKGEELTLYDGPINAPVKGPL